MDDVLSGADNFFQAFVPKNDPAMLVDKLGERYEVMRTNVKKWSVGAPIQAPAWFFSPGHLDEITAELSRLGWSAVEAEGFLGGNALAFLERSLPEG